MRTLPKVARAAVAAAVTVALVAPSGCSAERGVPVDPNPDKPFVLTGVSAVTEIAQLTGPDAINDTTSVGVAGADLGSMVNLEEKTFFLFGDTFGERDPDSYGGQGGFWRSNVAAWTTDDDPTHGITFDGWHVDDVGLAQALIEGDHDANDLGGEVTTAGIRSMACAGPATRTSSSSRPRASPTGVMSTCTSGRFTPDASAPCGSCGCVPYVSDDGRTVYFTLSLWGPYNVFWFSAELIRN